MIAALHRGRRTLESRPARATLWYVTGHTLQKGLDFLFMPVFALLLTPEEYGAVALFLTWMTIFNSTITLRLDRAVGRARYDYDDRRFRQFLSAIAALGMLTALAALGGLALLPGETLATLFRIERRLVLLAAGAAAGLFVIEIVLEVWLYAYRYRLYTVVSLGLAILRIVLSIAFIAILPDWLPGVDGALARALGIALVSEGGGLALGAGLLWRGRRPVDRAAWRYALAYSVPLIPHLLAGLLLSQFDRVLIGQYAGLGAAGVYSFAYQIGSVVFVLWAGANRAWVPWFFEQMAREERKGDCTARAAIHATVRARASQYTLLFAVVTAVLIVIGPPLARLVTPPEYREGLAIIPVVMAGCFFMLPHTFYVNLEYYEKRTGTISVGTILAAAANIALNVALIPRYGYPAAAWTTVLGYLLLFLFHAAFVRFRLKQANLFPFPLLLATGLTLAALAAIRQGVAG